MSKKPKGPNPYRKPSKDQIMLRWKVHPPAKAVAYVIRKHSDAQGWATVPYDQFKKEANIATNPGVNSALDELRKAGVLQENPGKIIWKDPKSKKVIQEASTYRLHQSPTVYKKPKSTRKPPERKKEAVPPQPPSTWPDVVGQ
jgi:arginyl-tRNA synthetase